MFFFSVLLSSPRPARLLLHASHLAKIERFIGNLFSCYLRKHIPVLPTCKRMMVQWNVREKKKGNFSVGGGGVCIFGHLVFSFREKRRQPTATFLQYPIGIFVPLFHIQMCCVFLSPCVCVFVCVGYTNVVSCRPCLIFSLKFFCFWIVSIFGALWWVGDNEPVYSGRNLGSPGFGGPGGIFTYPSSTANSHHPVSSWNNVLYLI